MYGLSVLIYQRYFYWTAVKFLLKGVGCKARKSVIVDPYTCLPDSNKKNKECEKGIYCCESAVQG